MNAAFALASTYGVRIEIADLGEWSDAVELRSEYDPTGPSIRVNQRVLQKLPVAQAGEFLTLAIGHELFHHREHLHEVERANDRTRREGAADAFARELLAQS